MVGGAKPNDDHDKMSNIIEEVKEEDLKSPNTNAKYSNMGQSAGG